MIEICPELVECGCTPGYYGCSEEYLRQYYKNAKMCEKHYGTEGYEFGCEAFEDNVIRAEKLISYIKNRFSFGDRVTVFSHHGFLEYLIPIKTLNHFISLPVSALIEVVCHFFVKE